MVTLRFDGYLPFESTDFLFPHSLLHSPFGAFMTLLYGLTAAPASQPRNAIFGQVLSTTIAVAFSYARPLPVWLRQSLAVSVAVSSMVKLGVTHPPAGASALMVASFPRTSAATGWGNMATSLVGNLIAIAMATFINNISQMRQYPIYWALMTTECRTPFVVSWSLILQHVFTCPSRSLRWLLPKSWSFKDDHPSQAHTVSWSRRKRFTHRVGLAAVEEVSV